MRGYVYVASDLHGCYDEYKKMIDDVIKLSKDDELYIIGDVLDRGKMPLSILRDIMRRENVHLIMGNHENFALNVLPYVNSYIDEISEDFYSDDIKTKYYTWFFNGGETTFDEFYKLSKNEQTEIIDFLRNLPSHIEIELNGKKYFLTHAGIDNYDENADVADMPVENFIWHSPQSFSTPFFKEENRFLVFGHVPTFRLNDCDAEEGKIFIKNNYIGVDCGCVFSKYYNGRLGCLRLNDMEEFYV